MKTRNLFQFILISILFCCSVTALAQQRFTYDGGYAATYARNNAWMIYGPGYNQNPFFNFPNNCANFVSQAIMAGMVKKTNPSDVFFSRYYFLADLNSPVTSPRRFFLNTGTNTTDCLHELQGSQEID